MAEKYFDPRNPGPDRRVSKAASFIVMSSHRGLAARKIALLTTLCQQLYVRRHYSSEAGQ
jgi:hypothetical protein